MLWKNASGNPVAVQPVTIQVDLPCEEAGGAAANLLAVNWGAVLAAAIQLIIAMMTGNSAAIATAIQALINAIIGK